MLGLTDIQLTTVMDMARTLPVEKRGLYLQRIAAMRQCVAAVISMMATKRDIG